MTAIFQSICQGQLGLRRYGQQLRAVASKRDGSGGILSWGTTPATSRPYRCPSRFQANPDYLTDFITEDNGSRLKLVTQRSTPLTLLTLPESIQDRIYSMVVHPTECTPIDLNHDKKFKCGLVHVNRRLYRTWRDKFFFENKFVLTMTTRQMRTTFNDFNHLRTFLRKTYMPKSTYSAGEPDTITARIVTRDEAHRQPGPSYVLRFELDGAVSLADVRINALPLVMETSTTQASNTVTIQICTTPGTEGPATMTASHTMTLHQLRLKIVLAIMHHVYSIPTFHLHSRDELPDLWINGFGEVVQVENVDEALGGAWEPASELVPIGNTEGGFVVWRLHPIDIHYRSDKILSERAVLDDDAQFFPFRRKVSEILPYLVKIVDRAGPYEAVLGG
ncbi:hypothetical protein J4E90_004547 [Alternaria incomplexa]|uniref:uncharacterized protein n=1 Tax=Alternaria incomplexa TaxID=1187928 RepID=UPI0022205D64|nr:uncharacterized protein J4E90_004547 [Alternaria incomplexa]KAI4916101.1 hypothetical protein J4E90_004547 [Alternaria incomplexa]